MKSFLFISLLILIALKFGAIKDYLGYSPTIADTQGEKVILYATSWCGYCAKVRELLRDNHIPYHEYDIDRSVEGHKQYKHLGGNGVPVVLINGVVVKGYRPGKILELAKQARSG